MRAQTQAHVYNVHRPPRRLLFYFIFAMGYMRRVQAVADHADRTTVTLGDYAVCVRHLPPDADPNELKAFFEKRVGEGLVRLFLGG